MNKNEPKSCCKGKCYLVKQLKKAGTNTESESKNTEKRIQLRDTDEFLVSKAWQPFLQKKEIHYMIINSPPLHLLAVDAVFVPPKTPVSL